MTDVGANTAESPGSNVGGDMFDGGSARAECIAGCCTTETEELAVSESDDPEISIVIGWSIDSNMEFATDAAGSGSDFDAKTLELSSSVML